MVTAAISYELEVVEAIACVCRLGEPDDRLGR
jgi:hypothetical protein